MPFFPAPWGEANFAAHLTLQAFTALTAALIILASLVSYWDHNREIFLYPVRVRYVRWYQALDGVGVLAGLALIVGGAYLLAAYYLLGLGWIATKVIRRGR